MYQPDDVTTVDVAYGSLNHTATANDVQRPDTLMERGQHRELQEGKASYQKLMFTGIKILALIMHMWVNNIWKRQREPGYPHDRQGSEMKK